MAAGRRKRRLSGVDGAHGSVFDDEEPPYDGFPEGKLVEKAPPTLAGEAVASMARKVDALEAASQHSVRHAWLWSVTLVLSLAVILLLVVYSLMA